MAYFLLFGSIWVLDRISKTWVTKTLPLWSSRPLLGEMVYLTHARNTGAAFGLLHGRTAVLSLVSVILLLVLFLYRRYFFNIGLWGKIGLTLIIAGAVGNLFDRLVFGYVIDFIDLVFWPVFNIADSAIVAGACLLIGAFWRYG